MTETDVKPALSAEEWREQLGPWDDYEEPPMHPIPMQSGDFHEYFGDNPSSWHRAAALFLYGQSFGFTWEDVEALRQLADFEADQAEYHSAEQVAHWRSIADRIAALLPPREQT